MCLKTGSIESFKILKAWYNIAYFLVEFYIMNPQYTIQIKREFCSAHYLNGHSGRCANMHGHTYEVTVEVTAFALDELGLGIDSIHIKRVLHQFVNSSIINV